MFRSTRTSKSNKHTNKHTPNYYNCIVRSSFTIETPWSRLCIQLRSEITFSKCIKIEYRAMIIAHIVSLIIQSPAIESCGQFEKSFQLKCKRNNNLEGLLILFSKSRSLICSISIGTTESPNRYCFNAIIVYGPSTDSGTVYTVQYAKYFRCL